MKKFLLILMSIILLCGVSFGLVYGITNFNKLSFNNKISEDTQQSNEKDIAKYKEEIVKLNKDIADLNIQIDNLQTSIENNVEQIEALETQKASLEQQVEDLMSSEAENEQEISVLNNQIATLNNQIETKDSELQSLEQQKELLNSQITELQNQLSYYQSLLSNSEIMFVLTDLGYSYFNGNCIWSDGENYYATGEYADSPHLVYDKTTKTWVEKIWNGVTWGLYGGNVWKSGNNIYFTYDNNTCLLNKETDTWEKITITYPEDLTYFYSAYVWTDGEQAYYSYGSQQYVFDVDSNTWSAKTWSGRTDFYKYNIFIFNGKVLNFDSSNSKIYELDSSTDTWIECDDYGFFNFIGNSSDKFVIGNTKDLVFIGDELYYFSYDNRRYVYRFDFENKGWVRLSSHVPVAFDSNYPVWTDGENYYYSLPVDSRNYYHYKIVILNND